MGGEGSLSPESEKYLAIYEKVKHLYHPNWLKEFCFIGLVSVLFIYACLTTIPFLAIVCFGFSQVVCGWLAHSMNHSRDPKLHELGNVHIPLWEDRCPIDSRSNMRLVGV